MIFFFQKKKMLRKYCIQKVLLKKSAKPKKAAVRDSIPYTTEV